MEEHRWEVLVWAAVNAEQHLYTATNDRSGSGGSDKHRPLLMQKYHI